MTSIKELIVERDAAYDTFTTAIITELSVVTSAAGSLVGKDLQDNLKWDAVSIIDDTLILSGQLVFPVGHVITTDEGEDVTVTEEMQSVLNRVVRVGVPVDMAETGTYEEVVDYLKNFDYQHPGANSTSIYDAENPSIDTVADIAGEFRSAGLTQEQIASMIVFAEQSKGKVN